MEETMEQHTDRGPEPTEAEVRAEAGPGVDVETLLVRLASAEAQTATLTAELKQERTARSAAEATLAEACESAAQAGSERDGLAQHLAESADRYRAALLAASPEVPPELVSGATIAEVDRSLAAARETVAAVRRRLGQQAAAERVPAGAPARGAPDLAALSPREKIALALAG